MPHISFKLLLATLVLMTGGCTTPVMKQSEGHIRADAPGPSGNIPAPVQISTVLPKPKPVQKPETYSVVVNGVKVQELLFALARDAKLNVDVHPGIGGTVTLNAIEQTLPQLLQRISKQADMRWELDGPNLVVMPDSPYLRIYKIDYLNMDRSTSGTVGVSSQISSGGASGGAAGGVSGNTSTTTLRNISANNFWKTLEENVKDILRETDKVLPGGSSPGSSGTPAPAGGSTAASGSAAGGAAPGANAPNAQQQQPGSGGSASNVSFREAASVIANAEAGILIIRATSRQHDKIQEFLDQVLSSAKRQVLIEATILEVQLNNQFQQGIDWSLLRRGPSGLNITQTNAGSPAAASTNLFVGAISQPNLNLGNLSATVRLLESFGNVRVLSSPKLSVLNNQTAILKVVDERVYFTIQASTTATQTTSQTTFTTTPNVVPVGFVMNVTPQIGDSDIVLLNLRPSLTRILQFVADPNPSLANPCGVPVPVGGCNVPAVSSLIPEIQRREMESMIKVNSGQIAVMGGLIEERLNDVDAGIPGFGRSQPISTLFSQRTRTNQKTELVVFLRPMVIRDPSIDGDYRAFRVYAPGDDFIAQPNPARPLEGTGQGSSR